MIETLVRTGRETGAEFCLIDDFNAANACYSTGAKLDAVRSAAQAFHERFIAGPRVNAVRTFDLITFPYPTRFGLWRAALSPAPYVMMTNRTLLVQFYQQGRLKTLLMNPTDYQASIAAPYFARQIEFYGEFITNNLFKRAYATVADHLQALGVSAAEIDYVTFDHLHVQDLRNMMGTTGRHGEPRRAQFPNAQFIFHRAEVESMRNLHPLQRPWYVPDALTDVCSDKMILIDSDTMLGDGLAILHTPGHTAGNISLAVNTDQGIFVTSENGISIDSYYPAESRIPGVRRYAREWGMEVVLNANTIENTAEQYISMIKEKTVAGSGALGPRVPNFFPSSELTSSWLAPLLTPTFSRKNVTMGELAHQR